VPGHHVGVEVHGVDGVGDGDAALVAENIEDVRGVALGAVGHKNFIGGHIDAARLKVIIRNRLAQKIITVLRAVALKGFAVGHFVHRRV
jgi:hypothetical protein